MPQSHPAERTTENAVKINPQPPRVIAFHLPQFHPIPENDTWWGPGFTEWTNVTRARPLFRGHQQPRLPADLGFYDLRVPETQHAQGELARRYGITAFCYWHYWFGGRKLLNRPVEDILSRPNLETPFCLAWANQTWTGIWHGAPNRILLEQTYPGRCDDEAHFLYLEPFFQDPRYLRVDRRPLFYVFRPEQLPNPRQWTDHWRHMADRAGLPGIYLVAEVSDLFGHGPTFTNIADNGFDDAVYVRMPIMADPLSRIRMRLRRRLLGGPELYPHAPALPTPPSSLADERTLPCVYPNWDNTPRAGRRGIVLRGSSPRLLTNHIRQASQRVASRPATERLIFIKSWNEWAEGNHLEPDLEYGHAWLRAVQDGLRA